MHAQTVLVWSNRLQQPHGQNCSKENVNKGDVAPGSLVKNQGEFHADSKGQHDDRIFLDCHRLGLLITLLGIRSVRSMLELVGLRS